MVLVVFTIPLINVRLNKKVSNNLNKEYSYNEEKTLSDYADEYLLV